MNKPIYRYLADKKWREYRRLILIQRITQMKVIPDVLAHIDPVVDTKLFFDGRQVQPGDFVDSAVSATPPRLTIQPFESGQKLVTIAVVDPDVPNWETDGFDYQCHFLAVNVPLSPTSIRVALGELSADSQVILPWLPPHAQKGSPYHRLAIFVMEQKDQKPLDYGKVAAKAQREDFRLRALETRHQLKPIGVHLFRTKWDEHMAEVMQEAGIHGWDIEFKRKRLEPLPYKPKNPARYR
jgi:large subunit ribosomal protein L35